MILIIIWEVVYKLGVDVLKVWKQYTFPSPIDVCKTMVSLAEDNTLQIAVFVSLRRIVEGYFISLVIGGIIGLLIVKYKYIDENFSPLVLGMQTLPSICWVPFAILWYGLNEKAILFVVIIGSTFAISISIASGIKNINPIYVRAARTMGASGRKLYLNVIFPASFPSIISGMKQGWSFAWRALMSAEMMSATKGLGQVLMVGRDLADISQVMCVMVVILVLGLLFDKFIFGKIETNIRYKRGLEIQH